MSKKQGHLEMIQGIVNRLYYIPINLECFNAQSIYSYIYSFARLTRQSTSRANKAHQTQQSCAGYFGRYALADLVTHIT